MNVFLSIRIELLSPVNIGSPYDLAQLDRATVSQVSVMLHTPESEKALTTPVLELGFDLQKMQFIDLIEFLQATQTETRVVLSYQGRTEELLL